MKKLILITITALTLTACGKKLSVKAIRATKTLVEATVTTTSSGTVEADQQAILGFTAVGRVGRINARMGDVVRRGQLLAELENTDLKTIAQDAESEVQRAKELFESGLVSKVALDEAKKGLEIARANLEKSIIRAPFDGVVTELNLERGELAQAAPSATKPPIRLVDQKPRIVKGSIDEVDLAKVRVGAAARIRIPAVRPTAFAAKVSRVVPFVSTVKEQDRTAQVEFEFTETSASIIPVGASADIEILINQRDGVTAVPTRLLLGLGDSRHVFKNVDGALVKTLVKTGIGNYERTEILSGVSEGDVLVYPLDDRELTDGMKVNPEIANWP